MSDLLCNVKVFHYQNSIQYRLYKRPLSHGKDKDIKENDNLEDNSNDDDLMIKHERSLRSSMNRTIQSIYGISRANVWEWFLTFTFDRENTDSSDYDLVVKKTRQFMNNIKKRYAPDLKYILVPELHSDLQHWHIHGLCSNTGDLKFIDSGIEKDGLKIYNLANWKWGFSTASKVQDNSKVSSYITKYITKQLCMITTGRRRYWASNNCLKADDCVEMDLLEGKELEYLKQYLDLNCENKKIQDLPGINQCVTYYDVPIVQHVESRDKMKEYIDNL